MHIQVVVVNERPGPLDFACLEAVRKRPQVGVSKQPTVGVVGAQGVFVEATFIVAALGAVRALLAVTPGQRGEARLGGGPIFGAVVLGHEIIDAVDCRVVEKVSPAGASRVVGAEGIGTQGSAELRSILSGRGLRPRGCGQKFRVALHDLAWRHG